MQALWIAIGIAAAIAVFALPASLIAPWFIAKGRFSSLARALGTTAAYGITFEASPGGVPLTATLAMSKGALRPRLELTLRRRSPGTPDAFELTLRGETAIDRLGKLLRINRELEVGDPVFDRLVYIESGEPDDAVRAMLSHAPFRRAVEQLIGLGFRSIEWNRSGGMKVTCWNPKKPHFEAERIHLAAQHLGVLLASPEPGPSKAARPIRSIAQLVAVMAAFIGAGMVVLIVHIPATVLKVTYPPISTSIYWAGVAVSLLVSAVAAPPIAMFVRGKSDSFRTFLFLVVPLALWVLPWSSVAVCIAVNGALDGSQPTIYHRAVRSMTHSTGKGSYTRIEVDGLYRGDAPLTLDISGKLYASLAKGDQVAVKVGGGFLGFDWLRGVERAH